MAKKKKPVSKVAMSGGLGYEGKVKVQLIKGSTIIQTKTYKNKGMPSLFKFISDSLAGTYSEKDRPSRIALFDNNNEIQPTGDAQDNEDYWNSNITSAILNNASATVDPIKSGTPEATVGYSTTYHFRIPYINIRANKIYKIALYSNNGINDLANHRLAYFLFTNSSGNWDPVEITNDLAGNYSIIIEWTLNITNLGQELN